MKNAIKRIEYDFSKICDIEPRGEVLKAKICHGRAKKEVDLRKLPKDLMGRLVAVSCENKFITLNHWSYSADLSEKNPENYYLRIEYCGKDDILEAKIYLLKSLHGNKYI